MNSTRERYQELIELIAKYNQSYHEENTSEISDYEFDMLNKELREIEKEYPQWVQAYTPTKQVGGKVKREAGVTVTHRVPMLSIEDVFQPEDVTKWVRGVKKVHPDALFCVEHKIDGKCINLNNILYLLKMSLKQGNMLLLSFVY